MKRTKNVIGWITTLVSFSAVCFWAYWGINEAFHEGWYHSSLLKNLSMTVLQYLSVAIIFLSLSLIALNYRKLGSGLFISLGIFALLYFRSNAGRIVVFIPLVLLALGFYFGEYRHKKVISVSFVVAFLLIMFSFGIPQLIRNENRFNDNDFGTRTIIGNNVELIWAPQGVGFPLKGNDWQTANSNCARLNEEGTELEDNERNKWRLPTRDEIVRSMTRKNKNAGGFIDDMEIAQYDVVPDKETPLWNPNSQVIYYWTNESKNEKRTYLVAYNGYILERSKDTGPEYQGYRCVKEKVEK
jgi:hypothetical protein